MKANQIKMGALLSYSAIFIGMAISLIYTPYMVKTLGQSEYGLYSLVNTIITYFTILDFGFGNAIVRYAAKYKAEGKDKNEHIIYGMFFIFYLIIALLSLGIGVILISNLKTIFKNSLTFNELKTMRILLGFAVFNVSISFPLSLFSSVMQANQKFIVINAIKLLRTLVNPLFMVGVLYLGYGSIGMIVIITTLNIIFNLYNIYYCIFNLNLRFTFKYFDISLVREIMSYSSFIFIALVVDRLFWSTDQIILGIMTNTNEVAIYTIAGTFTNIFISLSSVIGSMYLPRFTEMISTNETDNEIISNEFIKISRIQFLICTYIFFGFILVGKEFIILWVGKSYNDSYYISALIMFSLVVGVSQNAGIAVIQAKNMVKFRSYVQLVIAIFNVLLTVYLVPKYGGIGAAFATFISFFFGIGIIMSVYYQKHVKLNIVKLWLGIVVKLPAYILIFIIALSIKKLVFCEILSYTLIALIAIIFSILFIFVTYFFFMDSSERKGLRTWSS